MSHERDSVREALREVRAAIHEHFRAHPAPPVTTHRYVRDLVAGVTAIIDAKLADVEPTP